jgi:hypothetical protein
MGGVMSDVEHTEFTQDNWNHIVAAVALLITKLNKLEAQVYSLEHPYRTNFGGGGFDVVN